MGKQMLHGLIEMIPEEDVEILYRILVKFVPEVPPEPDELQAFADGRKDREENGTVSHDQIIWD